MKGEEGKGTQREGWEDGWIGENETEGYGGGIKSEHGGTEEEGGEINKGRVR